MRRVAVGVWCFYTVKIFRFAGGDAGPVNGPGAPAFQSTPPLRGRPWCSLLPYVFCRISIHAPLAGGDQHLGDVVKVVPISIHAPLAGGDIFCHRCVMLAHNFNPRPPCGGRLISMDIQDFIDTFQSTPPLRGATKRRVRGAMRTLISIHAPLAGGDGSSSWTNRKRPQFQSTPPLRGATAIFTKVSLLTA